MDESPMTSDEKKGVDPDEIQLARPSHNGIFKKLNWIKGPDFVQVEDKKHYFDAFWLSNMAILSEENLKEIEDLRTFIEVDIEDKMTSHDLSILHIGGFPFLYTLFYSTSTISDLKSKHFLYVDFPLWGGYISYKPDVSENEIESAYKNNRKVFESYLYNRGFEGQVFWGYLRDTIQYPNVIYFEKDNKFLYAEDVYQDKRDTHSLFFDYLDIFTSPSNKRNPNETINFIGNDSKRKTYTVEVKLGDIKILFGDISKEARIFDSFEISALDLRLNIRQPGLFKFHNRCKEVT